MAKGKKSKDLLTASQVARFCQVDLKTIHNWADRGEIQHFRTPGRHLRFRKPDVLDFLRKYGYPIPEALGAGKPKVVVLDNDEKTLSNVHEALTAEFEVETSADLLDSLLAIGDAHPDAVVLDASVCGTAATEVVKRLKARPATQHVRTVVYTGDLSARETLLSAGASALVAKPDTGKLRETLEALMGVAR